MSRLVSASSLVALALMAAPAAMATTPRAGVSVDRVADEGKASASPRSAKARPNVIVHRDSGCGCCVKWADHLRKAGFAVEVRVADDMEAIKDRLGVPKSMRSCHTAEVAGYFVEGHVPAADVERLLARRVVGGGLAVPGMPLGSPGMEVPGMAAQPFVVELIGKDGSSTAFARH